jgi:hypothetical protein
VRRDLIRRGLYLVPNSLVVSRGCPHSCAFCYKAGFFSGGRSFYVQPVEDALAEIERLPGRHLYFLDDHLFGHPAFAGALFDAMRGMGRLWQAAGTVDSVLRPGLLEKAVACGLRSLFVGFETLGAEGLRAQGKRQNLGRDYGAAVRRLHDRGVMVNASFVFGLDEDDASVFDRTVEWAIGQGIETATFHVLTPYPGTALFRKMEAEGRLLHRDWDLYDTRHAVFRPARMTPRQLEEGYWRAYREFYSWSGIVRGAATQPDLAATLRHAAYAIGWKKCEPVWDALIRSRRVARGLPLLERVLEAASAGRGRRVGLEVDGHGPDRDLRAQPHRDPALVVGQPDRDPALLREEAGALGEERLDHDRGHVPPERLRQVEPLTALEAHLEQVALAVVEDRQLQRRLLAHTPGAGDEERGQHVEHAGLQ